MKSVFNVCMREMTTKKSEWKHIVAYKAQDVLKHLEIDYPNWELESINNWGEVDADLTQFPILDNLECFDIDNQ